MMLYNLLNTFQLIQAPLFVQIKLLSLGGEWYVLNSLNKDLKKYSTFFSFIGKHNTG